MRSHCERIGAVPKQVDHRARRQQIAEALWRLTARDGLEGVSLRQVAAEAGISMGLVQHYFTTKDEMLRFALEAVSERAAERIGQRASELNDPDRPRSLVHALLVEMLPLDEERRLEAQVAFAFMARASVRPGIAERLRVDAVRLEEFLAEQIRSARVDQVLAPEVEAASLLAIVDGLSAHTLAGHHPPERALALLDAQLDRIFG